MNLGVAHTRRIGAAGRATPDDDERYVYVITLSDPVGASKAL
jgi:hypothetical protein